MKFTSNGIQGGSGASNSASAIKAYGNFDGGTLQIGFLDVNNAFVSYTSAETTISSPTEIVVNHGVGEKLAFRLTGATAPELYVGALSIR